MTATREFVQMLDSLKVGDLGLLRTHAGIDLDESVDGFDLFSGLWWPLRQKNQRAPRREVAWLVAKLYACCPLPQADQSPLASVLGRLRGADPSADTRRQGQFDKLLTLPLSLIEPALRGAIAQIRGHASGLDWVSLTDDLSIWEREATRLKWAQQYLDINS